MIFIDEYKQKYKTIKKDDKYYLLLITRDIHGNTKYKIEVTGKQNVYAYIKNNNLKKYIDVENILNEII